MTNKANSQSREEQKIIKSIKNILALQIGVDPEDIKDEDTFSEDLHMTATDLADFVENLRKKNIDTSNMNITSIKTVSDLVEALSSEELL